MKGLPISFKLPFFFSYKALATFWNAGQHEKKIAFGDLLIIDQ